jgi:type IV pilus assembly protein PilN
VITTNLSTKPFYNERAVHLGLLVLTVVVVVASVFNITRVFQLSHSGGQLAAQAGREEAQALDLHAQAGTLRATVDPKQIEHVSNEARKANDLIDRRTFSWTELLNRFETTLPDDVHITSVRPRVDINQGTMLTVTVVAKSAEDVYRFMENLDKSGAFANLQPRGDQMNDQGLWEAIIETKYTPSTALPVSQPAPQPAPQPVGQP